MTVPTDAARTTYTGDGSTVAYSTGFYFIESSDIIVVKKDPGGSDVIQVEGVDYTLTIPTRGSGAAGTFTFAIAPVLGATVFCQRNTPFVQNTALRAAGTYSPETHENALDRLTFQVQELNVRLGDVETAGSPGDVEAGSGLTSTGVSPMALHVGAGDGVIVRDDSVELDFGSAGSVANVTKAAASAGASAQVARIDHKHDVTTAAPSAALQVGGANAEGSSSSLARADHAHALTAPAAPADVTKAAASAGVSTNVARSDHKHDVSTAAAVEITDSTNAEGAATSLARSNHQHAHGNRGGGSLHAVAVAGGAAGFLSGSDKSKLDVIGTLASACKTHVYAYQNAVQSVPTGIGGTILTYGVEARDANGEFNPATGTYTAKDDGYVLVQAQVALASAAWGAIGNSLQIVVMKNGVTAVAVGADFLDAAVTRYTIARCSATVDVVIGDYLQIFATQNSGAAINTLGTPSTAVWIDRLL